MPDSRIRVLHLISSNHAASYFRAWAEHFDRSRFDTTLMTVPPAGALNTEMEARGVPTSSLDCNSRKDYPRAVIQLSRWLRKRRIDVLQTHLFDATLLGLVAGRLARTPVTIFTGHHSAEMVFTRKALPLAADTLCSRWLSSHVIVHCQQMKKNLAEGEGVPADKITVIPLGFDMERWQAVPAGRERIRTEIGLQGKTVVGAIGRFIWTKDYHRLLDAFRPVAEAHSDAVLLLIGEGEDRPAIEARAKQMLPGRVFFSNERSDVADCLAAMDLFVHASVTESFCQVIVEAQMVGRPVVSTSTGIAPEIIKEGVNGFLVPPQDTAGLQLGMEAAFAVRDRWNSMGEEGRQRCGHLSIQSTIAAHERYYARWLAEKRAA